MLKRFLVAAAVALMAATPGYAGWDNCAGGIDLKQVTAKSKDNLWGVTYKNQVYRFKGGKWRKTRLTAKQVSVAQDGSLAILSPSGAISIRDANGGITKLTGELIQVTRVHSGNGGMWGVNSRNQVYAYNAPMWSSLSGILKHITCGTDGTVWGVNPQGDAYLRDGQGNWSKQSSGLNLAEISCARKDRVWAVSATGAVYRYNGTRLVPVDGKLAHIEVAYDGTVYGLTGRGKLVIYNRGGKTRVVTPKPTKPTPPAPPKVKSVAVRVSANNLTVGQSATVTATVLGRGNRPLNWGKLSYSVDCGRMEGSRFIATEAGRATIRVTHYPSRVSGSVVVNVRQPRVCKTMQLSAATSRVVCGGQVKLNCSAMDQFNRPMNVQTEYSVRGSGTVRNGVFIAGNTPGRVEIIAFNRQYRVRTSCVIEVFEPVRLTVVTFAAQVVRIKCGQTIELDLQGFDQYLRPCKVRRRGLEINATGGQLGRKKRSFSAQTPGMYRIVAVHPRDKTISAVKYVYVTR